MIYQATKLKNHFVINELNADIYDLTFGNKQGVQKGDLYNSKNSCPKIVKNATCPPSGGVFVKTVEFIF